MYFQGPHKPSIQESAPTEDNSPVNARKKSVPNIPEKIDKEIISQERAKSEGPPKIQEIEKQPVISNGPLQDNFR